MTIRGSTESTHCPECGGIHHPSELTEGLCPIGLFDLLDDSHAETIDGVLRAAERRAADFPGGVAAAGAGARREEARRPGLTIPGYTVGDELARGGMGIVYRARQHAPDRDVAIKMLLPFSAAVPELRERFQVEVRTLAELDHSAILPIYETGDYEGLPWFAMKLAAGGSLAARIGTFAGQWRSIATLVATLADATHYAHERGVLHRDLKPGNILFDAEARAFVADFGLAKFMDEEGDLTRTHRAMGTPRYLAPEVAAGSARHATTASDIYSLGAILFELLTGRPPFEAEGLPDLLRRIADEEPRFPSHGSGEKIPVDLQVIALKCLAKIPASRYASARELAGELRSFLAGEPILARPSSRMEKLWRWTRREPALTSALGACGLILALGAVAVLRQLQETETARGIAVQKAREIEVQRGLAEAARTQAQQSELTMRQNLYAADMLAAQRAIDQNDLGTARLRLAAHRPAAGQSDLRGWEWRYFWGRARGQSFATVKPNDGPLTVLQFIDEGKRLAISNWQTFLYRLPSLELDTKIETPSVQSLAYAPDTGTMFFGIRGPSEVRRWTPGDRPDALSFVLDPKGRWPNVALSPDGQVLAIGTGAETSGWPEGNTSLYEPATGRLRHALPQAGGNLRFSPDGKLLATGSWQGAIKLWDPATGSLVRTVHHAPHTVSMRFSRDSRLLVACSHTHGVSIHDLVTGASRPIAHGHTQAVWDAEFSPDGRWLATGSSDESVRVWDVTSGRQKVELRGHSYVVDRVAWSPDGKFLASGGGDGVRFWDVDAAATVEPPLPGAVRKSFFAQDGKWLAAKPSAADVVLYEYPALKIAGGPRDAGLPVRYLTERNELVTLQQRRGMTAQLLHWSLPDLNLVGTTDFTTGPSFSSGTSPKALRRARSPHGIAVRSRKWFSRRTAA